MIVETSSEVLFVQLLKVAESHILIQGKKSSDPHIELKRCGIFCFVRQIDYSEEKLRGGQTFSGL